MTNPSIGVWLGEDGTVGRPDPINPYRYAGNDPINATDPSGLMAEDLKFDYGTYRGTLPGGSTTTKAVEATVGRQKIHGKITVGTEVDLKSVVDNVALDRGKGIYFAYEGDRAENVKWVQFFRIRVEARGTYRGEAKLPAVFDSFVTETAETDEPFGVVSTSSTKNPTYFVDSHSSTEPYYTSTNKEGQSGVGGLARAGNNLVSWAWDAPSIVETIANKAWKDRGDKQFWLLAGLPTYQVVFEADSYAVMDGQIIAHVPWSYSVSYETQLKGPALPNNIGKPGVVPQPWSTELFVGPPQTNIGAIDQALPNTSELKSLKSQYGQNQRFILAK